MPACRPYPGIVSICFIIGIIAVAANRPVNGMSYSPSGITIDKKISDSFPRLDTLLKELIADKENIFQDPAVHDCFLAGRTRLFISYKWSGKDTGAVTHHSEIKEDGYFYDSTFLNRTLFPTISKEYLVGTVIHEVMHIYVSFCYRCYGHDQLYGVDDEYLKKNFAADWEELKSRVNNEGQHILMSKYFVPIMTKYLYFYTNRQAEPALRESVAEAVTWGGLNETPLWRKLTSDTCYLHMVEIWSRNIHAGINDTAKCGRCPATTTNLLYSLQFEPLL